MFVIFGLILGYMGAAMLLSVSTLISHLLAKKWQYSNYALLPSFSLILISYKLYHTLQRFDQADITGWYALVMPFLAYAVMLLAVFIYWAIALFTRTQTFLPLNDYRIFTAVVIVSVVLFGMIAYWSDNLLFLLVAQLLVMLHQIIDYWNLRKSHGIRKRTP